ncbi:uncharacterized protein TM35_000541260 [Trypanosoma theileri]|uniref:WD repeat-containing protein 54 beta-propeller domain-containing protein n=1 Tax=Trypanosoma theileri TaxID=67003 RepID=A0A1X0NGN1_9TRYP|nr:uncharacterized protein TM35_000541260 [Trypanosoma theileri]ORC83902.1 hypothetical protein TM35_000541260 [Trypanosoma theileri]
MTRTFTRVKEHKPTNGHLPLSLLYNNLSFIEDCELLVYASRKDGVLMNTETHVVRLLPTGSNEREFIKHITAIRAPPGMLHPENTIVVLLTTASSTELWTVESPLGFIPHDGSNGSGCCGALSAAFGDSVHVVVGTSKGVVVFATFDHHSNTPLSVHSAVKGHEEHAVTAVQLSPFSNSDIYAATGDAVGCLLLWNRERQPFVSLKTSECITALQIVSDGDFVVAANGAGKLQMFDSRSGEMRLEICAHSRWINVLAFNPVANVLLSAAEDGYCTVWSAPVKSTSGATPITVLATHHIPHALPTGAGFNKDGSQVVIGLYDSDTMTQYTLT